MDESRGGLKIEDGLQPCSLCEYIGLFLDDKHISVGLQGCNFFQATVGEIQANTHKHIHRINLISISVVNGCSVLSRLGRLYSHMLVFAYL